MFSVDAVAYNIRYYRKLNGMTQQDLARELMISPQSVSKWECGAAMPDLEKLCMLSEILHIHVEQILGSFTNEKTMIAVDGGGTKTEFVLFTASGTVLNRIQKSGCNPNVCGRDATLEVLKSGINQFMNESSNVIGIFIGSAGFASGDNKQKILKELKISYPNVKIRCGSDIMNVISATTEEKSCIAAICGTGMVAYACVEGEFHRVGGWGYLLDNKGSGFAIGRDALIAALAQRDGVGKATMITDLVEEQIGSNAWEHISEIYNKGNSYIASFAPLVTKAYEFGDEIARDILKSNAAGLADIINNVAKNYNCGNTVVMAGSVVVKDEIYRDLVAQRLSRGLNLIVSIQPAVYGACVEACKLCGTDTDGLKQNFTDSYAAVL